MSCLTRLGCLGVVAVVAVGGSAWWLNGGALPSPLRNAAAPGPRGTADTSAGGTSSSTTLRWSSLADASDGGAAAIASLGRANGPAYVTLAAGDVAGFLATGIARALPRSASDPQVAIDGNRLHVRALVNLRDLAGDGALGTTLGITLGKALRERDTLHLAGTMDVVRPGLAQFHVTKLAVRRIDVPVRLIPQLIGSMRSRVPLADSLAPDALPIPLPRTVADIRIANDRITLYRPTR